MGGKSRGTPFITLRFTGPSFSGHWLPVKDLQDVAAYESLLIELAKRLYRKKLPEKRKLPKFPSLSLLRFEQGSACVVLALNHSENVFVQQSLFPDESGCWLFSARDTVCDVVASFDNGSFDNVLPAEFSPVLCSRFHKIGRSMADGDSFEFVRPGYSEPAVLTPKKRKSLTNFATNVKIKAAHEVKLIGTINKADWDKKTFTLRQNDGSQSVIQCPESFRPKVGELGGRDRDQVGISGKGAFGSDDNLKEVLQVDSIEIWKNCELRLLFKDLAELRPGWYDGEGLVPDPEKLQILADFFIKLYPDDLLLPLIVPTQEGNVLLEWKVQNYPSVEIDLADLRATYSSFGEHEGEYIEKEFDLSFETSFKYFLDFLHANEILIAL